MKKLLLALTLILTILLTSCQGSSSEPVCSEFDITIAGVCYDRTAPTITGIEDMNVLVFSSFDPLEGITAIDAMDGDLTTDIVVTGAVDTQDLGIYFLKYTVTDSSGNSIEELRYISVVYIDGENSEKVVNGDFSLNLYSWEIFNVQSGGFASFSVVNNELVIQVESINDGIAWEPRIHNEDIYFEQGKTYEISFDARSDLPRSIHVHIGELLDYSPWFTGFMDSAVKIHDLSTEFQTFTSSFTMNDTSNQRGAILFEFGDVEGNIGTENLITTIYIDNVIINEIE